jgi:PKD repeat protein
VAPVALVAIGLASGQAAGQTTFNDDFERADGPVSGWTVFSGPWQISGGAMTVTATSGTPDTVWIWAGDPPIVADPGDMEIRSKVTFGAAPAGPVGRHGGFIFCASQATSRASAGMTGYTLDWIDDPTQRGLRLLRWDSVGGGVPTWTALSAGTPDLLDIPQEWLVQIEADIIRVVADGSPVIEVSDTTYRGGRVGAWSYFNGTTLSLDDVEITYQPIELTACFTASTLSGISPLEVDFDASCTESLNGVATHEWDFGDGEIASGSKVNHTFLFGGSYMVNLTVTDTKSIVKTASATVLVQESAGSFSDDFERADGPVDGWTVFQGSWNIESGKLTTLASGVESWAWAGDPAYNFPANFTMTFTLEFLATPGDPVGRHGGVMFCATKPTWRYDTAAPAINGYTIDWIDRAIDHGIRLIRWDHLPGSQHTVLDIGMTDLLLHPDPPSDWQIVVEGEVIRIFGDGEVILEARDSTYRRGNFGLWGFSNGQNLALDDVEVTSPQLSPCFSMTPTSAEVGTEVAFDASCSSATGTPITTYSWDFGDGTTGLGMTATHSYSTEGFKTVKLTILTEGGLSATTERTFDAFIPKDSFEDDFNRADGPVDGWTLVAGDWSLVGGSLHLEAPGDPTGAVTVPHAFAEDPALRFADFTAIEFDVAFLNERPEDVNAIGRHGGVYLYGQIRPPSAQANSGYSIDWIDRAADHGYRLVAYDAGIARLLARGGTDELDPGNKWRIEIEGDTIRLLVDEVLKIEWTETADPKYRLGFVGLWAWPGDFITSFVQVAEFDNFVLGAGGPQVPQFHRGDANADGGINITDGIYVLNFLFLGGPAPPCREAANPNDDNAINITDGIYILNFLFLGGTAPTAPGPTTQPCGPDPGGVTGDLGCESYTKC